MKWSKTKITIENLFCEKLKGRVEIFATVYRKFHDKPSRVWITYDKTEILSAADVTFEKKHLIPKLVANQVSFALNHDVSFLIGEFDTTDAYAMEVLKYFPFSPTPILVTYQKRI